MDMTNPVTEEHSLYDACVGFMVSEKSQSDSWEKVAKYVHKLVNDGKSEKEIKTEFFVVEHQIKKDFKVGTLPGAWRSAKSTAMKAVKHGVDVLNDEGEVKGKTALEAEVKGTKPAVPRNVEDQAYDHLYKAGAIITSLTEVSAHRRVNMNHITAAIQEHLRRIPDA